MTKQTHVPLCHEVHGGVALFPVAAVPLWEPLGWKPIGETGPEPAPEATPEAAKPAEPAATPTRTSTKKTQE